MNEEKKKTGKPMSLVVTAVIATVLAFTVGIYRSTGSVKVHIKSQEIETHRLMLNSDKWQGTLVPYGQKVRAWTVTDGFLRDVRINQDPARVYHPPLNGNAHYGDNVKYIEWRLRPGQEMAEAELDYQLVPNN